MATIGEVNDQIVRFLAQEQSLDTFNEWLARNTWDIAPNSPAWSLIGRVERALAEYSNGHLALDNLRKQMSDIVTVQHVGISETATTATTASVAVRMLADAQAA